MGTTEVIFILEVVGTIAFALAGAMIAVEKNMDIFGVNVLGLTTAVGGGMIRDLILGIHPPNMFRNPVYAVLAVCVSTLLFIIIYYFKRYLTYKFRVIYDKAILICDAIGLGIFTVVGINTGMNEGQNGTVLLIFIGVLTGVGGGMLRDIMAGMTPFIFVKHVYACACIAGAVSYIYLHRVWDEVPAMAISATLVVVIRMLAAHYKWNLPRIKPQEKK